MIKNAIAEKIETIRLHRDFSNLPVQEIMELAAMASREFYRKGEFIFHSGDPTEHCHFVESGYILLSKESPTGKSFAFLLAEKGATLNAVTCFKPSARFFSARAIENASVLAISRSNFQQWVQTHPGVTKNIIITLGELLDASCQRIVDLVGASVEQRIINTLCMMSLRLGLTLPLTNKDLAEMTGTTRESTARTIRNLQDSGLLSKSRGKIKILNASKLTAMSTSPKIFV